MKNALAQLEVEDPHQFIAVTTDNPTTMKVYVNESEGADGWNVASLLAAGSVGLV